MGEHTKYFNKKAFAAIILSAMLLCLFAQDAENVNNSDRLRLEEQKIVLGTGGEGTSSSGTAGTEESGSAWLFIRMILVLALVITCIYAIVWLLRKSIQPGAENDPYLKKTASITLSPGKTVQIVTLQDKAYVLGVSDSSITLISEITDKEFVDSMNLNTPMTGGKRPADFASMLASLTKSAKRTEDFVKSKRERINSGDNHR